MLARLYNVPGSLSDLGVRREGMTDGTAVSLKPAYSLVEYQLIVVYNIVWRFTQMATNLSIDPKLLERTLELSGERTKKAAVNRALREFIARREQKNIVSLFGKLDWDKEYDYKKDRVRDEFAG
jgi:hypothetical protein